MQEVKQAHPDETVYLLGILDMLQERYLASVRPILNRYAEINGLEVPSILGFKDGSSFTRAACGT